MLAHSRELAVLGFLGAALWLPNCSQLTKVDWSLIPSGGNATGGSGGEAGALGEAGQTTEGGEGGVSGEAGASGAAGESGEAEVGDTGGGGASAGNGGAGGTLGGSGGTGGSLGGSGGATTLEHPTCSTVPAPPTSPPDLSNALVLFDGGAGGNGDRGGRVGLRATCMAAKEKLALPQSMAEAVISVDKEDQIFDMPRLYKIPTLAPHVVSPLGIEFANSWNGIWMLNGPPNSLVCAGVMPESATQWLTGSSNTAIALDFTTSLFGAYEYASDLDGNEYSHACSEWASANFNTDVKARVGSTVSLNDGGLDGYPYFIRTPILETCDVADDHILCIAFNPSP